MTIIMKSGDKIRTMHQNGTMDRAIGMIRRMMDFNGFEEYDARYFSHHAVLFFASGLREITVTLREGDE